MYRIHCSFTQCNSCNTKLETRRNCRSPPKSIEFMLLKLLTKQNIQIEQASYLYAYVDKPFKLTKK